MEYDNGVKWLFSKKIHEVKDVPSPSFAVAFCGKTFPALFAAITTELANCPECLKYTNKFPICRIPNRGK